MTRLHKASTSRSPRASSKAAPSWRSRILSLRPDPSTWKLGRFAVRALIACVMVGTIATFASWSSTGFLQPGGLDRLLAMKNTPEPVKVADNKRGGLDRGRLKSVIAGSAGPTGP